MRDAKKDWNFVCTYVLTCFFEVFRSGDRRGDRRAPIKLERVGRIFYWLVEKHFWMFFLRQNLNLSPRFVFIFFPLIKLQAFLYEKGANPKKFFSLNTRGYPGVFGLVNYKSSIHF